MKNKPWLPAAWAVGIIVFALFFIHIFFSFVPFNMDEFIHYHPITCHTYPLNQLNTFRESCSQYDLSVLPGQFWPLRSFGYSGSFPSVLYYPLFKLWSSPYSARLLGFLMLLAQAWLLSRLFRFNIWLCLVGLLTFFPYAFQHMVDTGPVAFHATSMLGICYLFKRWREGLNDSSGGTWRFPAGIGALVFLGIWTKLFYLILLPGLAGLGLWFFLADRGWQVIRRHGGQWRRDVLVLAVVATLPTIVLLNAKDVGGNPYYLVLSAANGIPLRDMAAFGAQLVKLGQYWLMPLLSTHRVFEPAGNVWFMGAAVPLLILGVLAAGLIAGFRRQKPVGFVVLNLLLFGITFLLMARNKSVWAMHHVVLAFPFLLLALFHVIAIFHRKAWMAVCLALLLLANLGCYYSLTRLKPQITCPPSFTRLNAWLNERYAKDHVFVVVDWGMYYLKGLYGSKDQCVLYMEPFSGEYFEGLKTVLARTGRKPLFIGHETNKDMASHLTEIRPDFDTGSWRIWH